MRDADLLKPIVEFLIKKRKEGENRPNNFSGKIIFLFSEMRSEVPRLRNLSKAETLLNALKQKDCWFNDSCQGAVHDYEIVRGTTDADAQITVDCSTNFLLVKLEALSGQIEEEAELNKKKVIISDEGIKIKDNNNSVYRISGKRKQLLDILLNSDGPVAGQDLLNQPGYSSLAALSDEVGTINEIFLNTFRDCINPKHELIINRPQGSGYRLNSDKYIFESD